MKKEIEIKIMLDALTQYIKEELDKIKQAGGEALMYEDLLFNTYTYMDNLAKTNKYVVKLIVEEINKNEKNEGK